MIYTRNLGQIKYIILDWVAVQLICQRAHKSKRLFRSPKYAEQLFTFLSKVLRIYFASSRRNDFTGAHNYYDLWLFDEFHETERGSIGTSFANTLLKVLDGQECRLDSKYGRGFTKKRNVPTVLVANMIPKWARKWRRFHGSIVEEPGPFQERVMLLFFQDRTTSRRYGSLPPFWAAYNEE